jgi:serine/threonine protein kinase
MLGDIDSLPSQESLPQHPKSSAILIQDRQQGVMVRESGGLPHSYDNSANEEDLVDKQLGNYTVRRLLGTGAFSKVYLAERHHHQQVDLFAIKTINKSSMIKNARFRSSIEREVAILKVQCKRRVYK